MDAVDRQIVHCLQWDGRASFRRIAEVIGVSEQTVARRFRSLHHAGALKVLVLPDARATGDETWFVRIVCRPDTAEAMADALAGRDDVSWVSITTGGGELMCVTRSSPEAGRGSLVLQRLPRTHQVLSFSAYCVLHMHVGKDAEWLAFDDPLTEAQIAALLRDSPPVRETGTGVITPDDRPLLTALAADGRAAAADLARQTGWPPSRVSARVDELLRSGAVHIETDLAPELFGFTSVAYLWLTVAPKDLDATGRALSLHPETTFAAAVTGTANLMAVVTCRDADALYTYVTTKVGALPAVRQIEIVPVLRRVKQAGTRVRNGRLQLASP